MTFEEYVLVRGTALLRLARLLSADEHQGEDLVQEVLVQAFVRWRRITALDQPDLYVRRMLINAHCSWRRRSSTRREVRAASVSLSAVSPDAAPDIAERDLVWSLLAKLPARQRRRPNRRRSSRRICCIRQRPEDVGFVPGAG